MRDKSKTRLVRKDFYFSMSEADANTAANKLQEKWAFIVGNWDKMYRPMLTTIGSPFATIPHWEAAMGKTPTAEEIRAVQDQTPTAEEIADAYADATLQTVFGLYKMHQKSEVLGGQIRNTTYGSIEKDCKNALAFLPPTLRMDGLTLAVLTDAKNKMFATLRRRTVKNYLGRLKQMLKWFYDETDYGKAHDKPTNFDKVFNVANAIRTDVKIPTPTQLKTLLAVASDRTRMYILLAMNCGMYQSDIGHLTLDEINLSEGYIFWDREKEPTNEFRVRHDLWPETLAAVRKHIQPTDAPKRTFIDYRNGKAEDIDCSRLAFVDPSGHPIYQVRENGVQYDKITEAWREIKRKLPTAPIFRSIRKATNDVLCDLLNDLAGADNQEALFAVNEISDMFLAQGNPKLKKLYKKSGLKMYGRMNKYLAILGDSLRKQGVFDAMQDAK
jgi:integrase